jgi:ubiquinone/menaquinone biosynthesis C-methylase UbiE
MEYEREHVSEIYNKICHHFNKTRGYQWKWITDFIESFSKDTLILDIGCGNGRNMIHPDYRFIGIDNSVEFIKLCISKNLSVKFNDMTHIDLPMNQLHAIICIASFHHLKTPERRLQALKEMYRIIQPEGRILLSVWSIGQPEITRRKFTHYGDTMVPWNNNRGKIYNRYYYIFKIDEIKSLFKKADLTLISHTWEYGNEIFILTK